MLLDLKRYQDRLVGGRDLDTGVGNDSEDAATALRAADGLGPLRSRLVLRRYKIIFRNHWLEEAALYPGEDEARDRSHGISFSAVWNKGKTVDLTSHALHQAYATPPGGRAQRVLAHHLRHLGKAR